MAEQGRKKIRWSSAWRDARELVWAHRRRLLLGAVLMLVNQATGLVLLAGSFVTAVVALCILFWLNWRLTAIMILVLGLFGGALAFAFTRLRPLFRERGEIMAALTGRLAESLGGIRIVKAYTAEKREALTFARGAHKLFRNIAKSMTGVSATQAFSSLVIGAVGVVIILVGGASVVNGQMTVGDLFMYVMFTGM